MILEKRLLKKNSPLTPKGGTTVSTPRSNAFSSPLWGLGVFIAFAVLPLAAGLVFAALYSVGLIGALSQGFTFEHWYKILTDNALWSSLILSLAISIVSITIAVSLALLLTVKFGAIFKKRTTHFLLYLPLSMPPIITAFWTFQALSNSGILSRIFYKMGLIPNIENFPTLINDSLYFGVITAMVLATFPVFTLLFLSFYQSENIPNLQQLAQTLGATTAQTRSKIIIPILLKKARPNIILYAIFLFGAFEMPLLLGRQSPRMMSVLIHSKFNKFNLLDLPQAYVLTVIYALIVLTIVFLLFRKK
jgi:putative spermidine/putrescine transport system permease protein